MNRSKFNVCIVNGFNRYFDVPNVCNGQRAKYRSAVVVKKRTPDDEWEECEALVWRIIQKVSSALSCGMKIECSEAKLGYVLSLEQWRRCDMELRKTDPDDRIGPPTVISFTNDGVVLCRMSLEDWSDIWKIEPYALSYTYSFYSCDGTIDAVVVDAIREELARDPSVGDVVLSYHESATPKLYWRWLECLKNPMFIFCTAVCVLVLEGVILSVISPNGEKSRCRQVIKSVNELCVEGRNLHPRLIEECTIDEAETRCPGIKDWVLRRKSDEWVPVEFLAQITEASECRDKCLFATYEAKIARFEPDSFHEAMGTLVMTNGSEKTIYIYSWDKRYAPMVMSP